MKNGARNLKNKKTDEIVFFKNRLNALCDFNFEYFDNDNNDKSNNNNKDSYNVNSSKKLKDDEYEDKSHNKKYIEMESEKDTIKYDEKNENNQNIIDSENTSKTNSKPKTK